MTDLLICSACETPRQELRFWGHQCGLYCTGVLQRWVGFVHVTNQVQVEQAYAALRLGREVEPTMGL